MLKGGISCEANQKFESEGFETQRRFENHRRSGLHAPAPAKKSEHSLSVLIVDDDVDSVLQIDHVLSHLGCQTTCVLDWHEAKQKICALKPEIIILDWFLDENTDGADIVDQCNQIFSKFADERGRRISHRPQIITYSTLLESEVELPRSPYFDYLDHWQKPLSQRELLARGLWLIDEKGR